MTGRSYEEVWRVGDEVVHVDGVYAGYYVEVKWAGRNNAAWASSPYNPAHRYYDESKIVGQARRYLKLNQATNGNGVRYAVFNEAARNHFESLFRQHFPDAVENRTLRVFHVPGNGM